MNLLALDTSNRFVSVALFSENGSILSKQKEMERGQGENLIPIIKELLKEAQKDISDITAVAVAVGPGSFAGLRIGIATAKAFGLALKIPVLGVTNLEALACNTKGAITVLLDSKRGDYFVQHFMNGQPLDSPHIESVEVLKKSLPFNAVGDISDISCKLIGCNFKKINTHTAISVAQIAHTRIDHPLEPEPLYLRDADVTV